jgi:hypothetical protein
MYGMVLLCLYFRGEEEKLRLVSPALKEFRQCLIGLIQPRSTRRAENVARTQEVKII